MLIIIFLILVISNVLHPLWSFWCWDNSQESNLEDISAKIISLFTLFGLVPTICPVVHQLFWINFSFVDKCFCYSHDKILKLESSDHNDGNKESNINYPELDYLCSTCWYLSCCWTTLGSEQSELWFWINIGEYVLWSL